jgi:hypothetical protein
MPEILYRYTTAGGLFGILQNKSIWATDARFLNDAQEIIYALDGTCEYLRERLSGEPSGTPQHAVIGTAIEMLKEPDLPTEIYLSCFCEDGDLLSQWRGYAAGQGYAIGFDAQQLAAAHAFYHNHPQKVQLIPVTYGLEQERERLREIISSVDLGSSDVRDAGAHHFIVWNILPLLASVKHPSFREEQEWRLVCVPDVSLSADVQFRPSDFALIPYLNLRFDSSAVHEIVVGPGDNADLRCKGVDEFLRNDRDSYRHLEVKRSSSPFRP